MSVQEWERKKAALPPPPWIFQKLDKIQAWYDSKVAAFHAPPQRKPPPSPSWIDRVRRFFLIPEEGIVQKPLPEPLPDAWQDNINDINSYPKPYRDSYDKILKEINRIIDLEIQRLTALSISPPKVALAVKMAPDYIGWREFSFPYDKTYFRPGDLTGVVVWITPESFHYSSYPYHCVKTLETFDSVFCAWGTDPTLNEIRKLQKEKGILGVIERYSGRWFNRNPYELFEYIVRYKYRSRSFVSPPKMFDGKLDINTAKAQFVDELQSYWASLPRIEEYSYVTTEKVRARIEQRNLCNHYGYYAPQKLLEDPAPETLPPTISLPATTVGLKILPTLDAKLSLSEEFFERLINSTVHHPISFMIAAAPEPITIEISCAPEDQALIERLLSTYFSSFSVQTIPTKNSQRETEHCIYAAPIILSATLTPLSDFAIDPYAHLFTLLAEARVSSSFSVTCQPAPKELTENTRNKLQYLQYREESDNEDNRKKNKEAGHQLYRSSDQAKKDFTAFENRGRLWMISVCIKSPDVSLATRISDEFLHHYTARGQEWKIIKQQSRPVNEIAGDSNAGQTLPVWGLASSTELAALAHFPSKDIKSNLLETASMKSKQPPSLYTDSPGIRVGTNEHRRETRTVVLPDAVRDRHCYIIGKTRMGKSTLITNMALQDIEAGRGVGVIDPHGDLVEDILERIPKHRVKDVIYFDAKDRDRPLALNPLSVQDEDEIEVLAADLNLTFRRVSATDSWGDRMDSILRYVIHTLLRSRGASFMDIQTILENPKFRERVVSKLPPGPIANWWQYQFSNLPKDATAPILNRMTQFVLSPSVNNLLSQPDGKLNLFDVMQGEKVFLVNLSQGKIGTSNAHLLGSLIVSQIQQAAMRRAGIPRSARYPFYLYIDEFQNFISSAFEKILSEAGKYQLCLTLAHQYISQLDDKTRGAILGNVGTMILFQIGEKDANMLKAELGNFEPRDATDIERYHAFCKPATKSSETFTLQTLPPPKKPAESFADEIIEQSKQQYSTRTKQPPKNAEPAPVTKEQEEDYEPNLDDEPVVVKERILKPRPAPLNRMSSKDRVLHYLAQAEYLSQQQIIELCFKDFYSTDASRKRQASTQLNELVTAGSVRKERFGSGNVFFAAGRKPNFSDHNLALRDLFVKISRSDFELSTIKFFLPNVIPGRSPDLYIEFASTDKKPITTFWEYDTGSEFPNQLQKKMNDYRKATYDRLTFVVETEERLQQLRRTLQAPRLWFVVLGDFESLADAVFYSGESENLQPFFL